jgi:hypothetical protein
VPSLVVGFALLGLLIGNLVGMTSAPVTSSVLSLLFAFTGGSILVMLEKLTVDTRRLAGQAIAALSVACLIGVYAGILVTEHQLLSPPRARDAALTAASRNSRDENTYLRSAELSSEADAIDLQVRQGALTYREAYDRLSRRIRAEDSKDAQR